MPLAPIFTKKRPRLALLAHPNNPTCPTPASNVQFPGSYSAAAAYTGTTANQLTSHSLRTTQSQTHLKVRNSWNQTHGQRVTGSNGQRFPIGEGVNKNFSQSWALIPGGSSTASVAFSPTSRNAVNQTYSAPGTPYFSGGATAMRMAVPNDHRDSCRADSNQKQVFTDRNARRNFGGNDYQAKPCQRRLGQIPSNANPIQLQSNFQNRTYNHNSSHMVALGPGYLTQKEQQADHVAVGSCGDTRPTTPSKYQAEQEWDTTLVVQPHHLDEQNDISFRMTHPSQTTTSANTTPKLNTKETLRVLAASVEGMKYWSQYKTHFPMMFCLVGSLNSAATTDNEAGKTNFVLKDQAGHSISCVFYNIDRDLPRLVRGYSYRCMGQLDREGAAFRVVTVRQITDTEIKLHHADVAATDRTMRTAVLGHREF